LLKVRLYSTTNQEKGEVECESVDVGCGWYYLTNVETINGKVDVIDILHHHQGGVSFAIDVLDIVLIKGR